MEAVPRTVLPSAAHYCASQIWLTLKENENSVIITNDALGWDPQQNLIHRLP